MMNRNTLILLLVATISMIAGFGLFQFQSANSQPTKAASEKNTPSLLSAIPFTDLQGQNKVLGDWNQPILIVNFWAPWCAPCRREIPALVEIQSQNRKNVQVIGLALDSIENVENFQADHDMNYASFLAGANIPMYNAAFNNKSGSLPYTAIIDQQRKLAYTHTGEITARELRQKIEELL